MNNSKQDQADLETSRLKSRRITIASAHLPKSGGDALSKMDLWALAYSVADKLEALEYDLSDALDVEVLADLRGHYRDAEVMHCHNVTINAPYGIVTAEYADLRLRVLYQNSEYLCDKIMDEW